MGTGGYPLCGDGEMMQGQEKKLSSSGFSAVM
jgi:hypothetical protein